MYTKDKSHRITLRLNDRQFRFVQYSADLLEVSPSDFLRMVINTTMASSAAGLAVHADEFCSALEEFATTESPD